MQKRTSQKSEGRSKKRKSECQGAIRYSDKKRFVEFLTKSNYNNFYKVLKLFYQDLISEWVEAGNNREDFTEKGCQIVIVLDNASFHKKRVHLTLANVSKKR